MATILSLVGVVLIPIIVVTFLSRNKSFFEKSIVKGFGLGVYLMLVIVLFYESVEIGGITEGLIWLLVGLFFSFLIGFFLKEFHHHHSEEEKISRHSRASTLRILVSDFFHNIVDGLAIIAGFYISPTVGVIAFLGILGHQIVQQVGQQILLVGSGIESKKAIFISFFIALSIFLGFAMIESLEAILLGISAGIVAWKVWADLIHLKWDKKIVSGFVLGSLLLAIILLSVSHKHGDEYGYENERRDEQRKEYNIYE